MRWWMILGGLGAAGTLAYVVNKNSGATVAKKGAAPAAPGQPSPSQPSKDPGYAGPAQAPVAKETPAQQTGRLTKPTKLRPIRAVKPAAKAAPEAPQAQQVVLDASNSLPALSGLANRESLEPGFVKLLIQTVVDHAGNPDRVAAVMARRSKFAPSNVGKLLETGSKGYGLMGWLKDDAFVAPDNKVKAISEMNGQEQIQSALVKLFNDRPWLATDPALIVLIPYEGWLKPGFGAGRSDKVVVVEQPNVDIIAHAQTKDEALWPRLGHWDKNKDGIVTLGDIRRSFYDVLKSTEGRIG